MKTNKKFYITFGIMAAVVLALIVSLVSVVLAYTQQTVTTRLNINYTTVDVDGSVEATYTIGNTTNYLQRADGQGTKITFNAEDTSNQNASLVFPTDQIQLTSTNKSIILQYMFTNTGSNVYTAIMSLSQMAQTNMKMEFSLDGDTYSENQYALVVRNTGVSNYYIKITVLDVAHNASFSGDISWLLENYVPTGTESEISFAEMAMTSSTFTLNEETQTYAASYNGEALIGGKWIVPSSVGSVPVTEIVINGNLTQEQENQLTSVFIPASVTSIGESAFIGCFSLTTVTFEENSQLTSIGSDAFRNCESLTSIEIPASVTSIGDWAFLECFNLTSVIFEENSQLTTIGGVFGGCSSLKEITIPASVTSIEEAAFGGCESLTTVTFAENSQLTSIGDEAFSGCESLTEITIPAGVTSIGWAAFGYCESLTSVTFANKTGWKAGTTTITEAELSDLANAATLLKDTYVDYSWERS